MNKRVNPDQPHKSFGQLIKQEAECLAKWSSFGLRRIFEVLQKLLNGDLIIVILIRNIKYSLYCFRVFVRCTQTLHMQEESSHLQICDALALVLINSSKHLDNHRLFKFVTCFLLNILPKCQIGLLHKFQIFILD